MNKKITKINVGLMALALGGTTSAMAQEESAIQPYKGPKNSVSAGVLGVTKKSAKFGEYTGLNKSRLGLDFDLNGGDGLNLTGGTRLWNLTGTDLGTTSRSIDGFIGNQGKWKVRAGYDELKHYISDSYQTPYTKQGNGNYLPGNFGTINAATGITGTNHLTAAQLAALHTEEVATHRKTALLGGSYFITPSLEVSLDYSHLDQSGSKLLGTSADGSTIALPGSTGSIKTRGRANNVILNPTEYKTDTVNANLTWFMENGSLTGGYYGSFFRDKYTSVNFQNAIANGNAVGCLGVNCFWNNNNSTAPDNNFHQLNLSGGYRLAQKTKVTTNLSYGLNTQKDDFAPHLIVQPGGTITTNIMQDAGLPGTTLNGKVDVLHGDVKVVNTSFNKLALSAGVNFNERKNRTLSKNYSFFYASNSGSPSAVTAINSPFSYQKWQGELAGDYRFTDSQSARLFVERENTKRWCVNQLTGHACVPVGKTNENKAGANYKLKFSDALNFNAGYTYANRIAFAEEFITSNQKENGDNKNGFVAAHLASRVRHAAKSGVQWQLTDKIDLSLSGSYTTDHYRPELGVQKAYSRAVNLDAGYAFSENLSFNAYSSLTKGKRRLLSAQGSPGSDPALNKNRFINDLTDTGMLVGFAAEQKGFFNGKMDVGFDASYSLDKTWFDTVLLYRSCDAVTLNCQATPTIKSRLLTVSLDDSYNITDNSSVNLKYTFQKRRSEDYFYNSYLYPVTPTTLMPTNETAPSYTDNLIAVNYSYRF